MLVVPTQSLDPYENLALEEHLLELIDEHRIILMLWQSKHAIIIGKNQNPWRECSVSKLLASGGKLARRTTGGGTVYHDEGNLNFSFFTARGEFKEKRQYDVIIDTLREFGITAHIEGSNSLFVGDRKISGNAFYFRKNTALHHGTLLVETDLEALHTYLEPSQTGIATRAIASRPAKVVNLRELNSEINVERLAQCIVRSACAVFGEDPEYMKEDDFSTEALKEKYASWDWIYGSTPKFELTFEGEENGHKLTMKLAVKRGAIIEEMSLEADGVHRSELKAVEETLRGSTFNATDMTERLRREEFRGGLFGEVADWVARLEI